MAQHDYSIANQGFPATRADINNVLSAIATNNSGTSAPSAQFAGQFWIDTTSSTWTLYIHDGADDIQFATIDTSANTVNFIDSELADGSVTNAKLGADAVDGDKIADDSINSEHYVDGSIDTAHIADSQITTAKINDDAVTTAKINDNAVTNAKLSFNANQYRNIIINGDMSIAQRGTSVTGITSSGYYTVDRFNLAGLVPGTFTQSQSTDVPSGQGFAKSLKLDCTTSASSASMTISQKIEGQNLQYLKKGTSNAESLTLSFWVKSNKTGTYIVELIDTDNNRHIGRTYTIDTANTWEKKILNLDGDTTGTLNNDNGDSFNLQWWLSADSSLTSGTLPTNWQSRTTGNIAPGLSVNLADSTANEWYITGVQLEAGTTASDFEFLPYDVNLGRCERYFETIADGSQSSVAKICNASAYTTTNAYSAFQYRTIKRTAPSLYVTTGSQFYRFRSDGSSFPCTDSTLGFGTATDRSGRIVITISGATAGYGGWITINSQATGFVALDSEL